MSKFTPSIGSPARQIAYNTLSVWGDSRSAQNWTFSNSIPFPQTCGHAWWLEMMSRSLRLNVRYNFGVSGDTIGQLVQRLLGDVPNAYGVRPSQVPPTVAMLLIGTNSINGAFAAGDTSAELAGQLRICVDWLVAHQHVVILVAETPRGGTSGQVLSTDDFRIMREYRALILPMAGLPNVNVVDPFPRLVDTAFSDGRPQDGMLNADDLHFSSGTASITAEEAANLPFVQSLPELPYAPVSNGDQYDAASNRTGCLNLNPMLIQGTGGTLGSNALGLAPQNYTLSTNNAGITVTGSFVMTTYKGALRPAFRMVIAGTPTANNSYAGLRQTGLFGKLAVADRCFGGYEVVVSAGHTNFLSPAITVDTGVTGTRLWGGSVSSSFKGMPSQAAGRLEGMPLTIEEQIAAGTASVALDLRIYFGALGIVSAATVDFISAFARKA